MIREYKIFSGTCLELFLYIRKFYRNVEENIIKSNDNTIEDQLCNIIKSNDNTIEDQLCNIIKSNSKYPKYGYVEYTTLENCGSDHQYYQVNRCYVEIREHKEEDLYASTQ